MSTSIDLRDFYDFTQFTFFEYFLQVLSRFPHHFSTFYFLLSSCYLSNLRLFFHSSCDLNLQLLSYLQLSVFSISLLFVFPFTQVMISIFNFLPSQFLFSSSFVSRILWSQSPTFFLPLTFSLINFILLLFLIISYKHRVDFPRYSLTSPHVLSPYYLIFSYGFLVNFIIRCSFTSIIHFFICSTFFNLFLGYLLLFSFKKQNSYCVNILLIFFSPCF